MFRLLLLLPFLWSFPSGNGDIGMVKVEKVYHQTQGEWTRVYADNPNSYPITVRLYCYYEDATEAIREYRVIAPYTFKKEILKHSHRLQATRFHYDFRIIRGDVYNSHHDDSYMYQLPYLSGCSFRVSQGYFGGYSHQGRYALDFVMPRNTHVCAMREGVVIKVEDHYKEVRGWGHVPRMGNNITILHSDNTIATYLHLNHKGSMVKEGDYVFRGQEIALSGNTGWSMNPHLHVEVFRLEPAAYVSIPTQFDIGGVPTTLRDEGRYGW